MATLKEVQNKISSVKKTKQITKAMNMVATSRLRGAQMAMDGFRPFAEKFSEVLGSLSGRASGEASPLLSPRDEVKNVHVVLCTSDRGLCGGFNINLIEKAEKFIQEKQDGADVTFSFTNFGKKGRDWARKNKYAIEFEYLNVVGTAVEFSIASNAGRGMIRGFLEETYDEVYIIYSNFAGMGKQIPMIKQLLPIPPLGKLSEGEAKSISYFDPITRMPASCRIEVLKTKILTYQDLKIKAYVVKAELPIGEFIITTSSDGEIFEATGPGDITFRRSSRLEVRRHFDE